MYTSTHRVCMPSANLFAGEIGSVGFVRYEKQRAASRQHVSRKHGTRRMKRDRFQEFICSFPDSLKATAFKKGFKKNNKKFHLRRKKKFKCFFLFLRRCQFV